MSNGVGRRVIGVLISVGSYYMLKGSNGEGFNMRLAEVFSLLLGVLLVVWSGSDTA